MIFNMKLQPQPFEAIKSGRKDIEMRLYDEKRKQIKKEDLIEFTSLESGEKILCKVVNLHIFSSFKQLYAHFDKKRLGYHETKPQNQVTWKNTIQNPSKHNSALLALKLN